MSKNLVARIILPSETLVQTECDMVNIPGVEGVFSVLPEHMPLIADIDIGVASIINRDVTKKYYVYGGIAQINDCNVNIMTEHAANIAYTNRHDIMQQINDLTERLSSHHKDSVEYEILWDNIQKYRALLKCL